MSKPSIETHQSNMKRLVIAGLITLAVIFVVAGIVSAIVALRTPSQEDYKTAQTTVSESKSALRMVNTASNAYFKALSQELYKTKSVEQSVKDSGKQYDVVIQNAKSATEKLEALKSSKIMRDDEVRRLANQYIDIATDQNAYLESSVRSYADYRALFSDTNDAGCFGVIVRKSEDLSRRKAQLDKAADVCFKAINGLKKSGNSTYKAYAVQLERQVKQMQSEAANLADGEKTYKQLKSKKDDLEAKLSKLSENHASNKEYRVLDKEVQSLSDEIADSQAEFQSATDRYVKILKGLPGDYIAVLSTQTPDKIADFNTVADAKLKALRTVLDDKQS